ncbi:transporter substrate-binding domain-containing protein [Roseibium salinum]|uniref:Transporter substrate-binding domain-containing protein n=1 Tax=Roseibium salinum TaxID=1604349 RepID=A0ABT3QXY7_9HYPH|nr:transporter substrate-binding domain-containing protein [Roseibium sp. DSM 29163]MCX2721784.1 transporter substrate-binding domain-containing protein [Roseibium sp. DSM 29163]
MFKKIAGLAGAALAAAMLMTAPASAELKDILSAGKVRVGIPENFPPFGSLGPEGEYVGYDVDVAKMIAEDLGVELELVPVTSKQRIPFLETDRVDLVVATLGANPERAKSIWFSHAYAPFFSGAFAKPDVLVTSIADFAGKTIAVTGGTLEDLAITDDAPEGAEIIRFGDNAATIAAYVSGQADVIVTGNMVALGITNDNPDLKLENKFIIANSPCYIGVKSGNIDLLQWVNVFVLHNKLNGALNGLSEKWLNAPLTPLPAL